MLGHEAAMLLLLAKDGVDPDSKDKDGIRYLGLSKGVSFC